MTMIVTAILWWLLKLALLLSILLYGGLVLTSYIAFRGFRYQAHFDFDEPAWSLEQFALWCGVKALGLAVRLEKAISEQLIQASADVGEWFISKCNPKTQAEFRSRFL